MTKNILCSVLMMTFLFLSAVSCVGVVEETASLKSDFGDKGLSPFNYSGVVTANVIAEDKIEVEFQEELDSETHTYFLHVNENEPIKLSLESIGSGQQGNKKFTLKDLQPNTDYKLRISVTRDDGVSSKNENSVIRRTFDNRVSDFDGIAGVEPVTGKSHSSAKVSWISTDREGSLVLGNYDTVRYEVSYIPASSGLGNMNMIGAPGRGYKPVTVSTSNNPSSTVVNGLTPDTEYYFQVRAVHKLYSEQAAQNAVDGTPITLNRDLNTTWIRYRTSAENGDFDYKVDSVVVKNVDGIDGLTQLDVFWEAPKGLFEKYRVFYREYTSADGTSPMDDDELTAAVMQSYINSTDTTKYTDVTTSETSVRLTGLKRYSYYQVKVVPCLNVDCTVSSDDSSDIISPSSLLRARRVEVRLAPFFGINFINNPDNASDLEKIKLVFDPPTLSSGHATRLRVHCIDYDDHSQVVELNDSAGATGGVGNCDGLQFSGLDSNISKANEVIISPVKNISTSSTEDASYCFSVNVSISGTGLESLDTPRADWIVRCIQPEIKTPNLSQFSGLDGSCSVNGDKATVNWSLPTGGIYNKFRIFKHQKASESDRFNFFNSVSTLNSGKYSSELLDSNVTTHEFEDLTPGQTYFVGILALSDNNTPSVASDDVYSEYNLNTLECKIPYPKADFSEWTRIFAIGPKINGKVPLEVVSGQRRYRDDAFIFEALNSDGIPYEVGTIGDYLTGITINSAASTENPPGDSSSFGISSTTFDGASDNGFAASRSGIVTLAWKNVALQFAQTTFDNELDGTATRSTRSYGYRVYRSSDNRKNWVDLTQNSGLIYPQSFTYYVKSNSTATTEDMGFFTDYSVSNLNTDPTGTARAREYWYRIVPVFNGVELVYNDATLNNPHNIIKVTLPPPNMALVHRKMANRNICSEMDKSIRKTDNYSCDYNGLGSRPKDLPWRTGETVYDAGGDLLVDRFELGCNFTRGDSTSTPQAGNSFFKAGEDYNVASNRLIGLGGLNFFKGYATDTTGGNTPGRTNVFRGCTMGATYRSGINPLSSAAFASTDAEFNDNIGVSGGTYLASQFDKLMYGDCILNSNPSVPARSCIAPLVGASTKLNYPGMPNINAFSDTNNSLSFAVAGEAICSTTVNDRPNFAVGDNNLSSQVGLTDQVFIDNVTLQAEHLAVVYNRASSSSAIVSPFGPNGVEILENDDPAGTRMRAAQSCFINLAAIGSETGTNEPPRWRSRWISASAMHMLKNDSNGADIDNVNKTVSEVHSNSEVYSSVSANEFRVPPTSMWNGNRFEASTKIGRIISSSSAKLPPLTGISKEGAARLCNSYEVEVGFEENGNFISTEAAKPKRLLRKSEFISSGAFPETLNDTSITNLESGVSTSQNRCISGTSRTVSGGEILNYNGNNRDLDGTHALTDNGSSSYLWTGTSSREAIQNSGSCVSRYGIQDIIGNLSEFSSENLFCDYSLDTLYYGVSNNPNKSIVIAGYVDGAIRRLRGRDGYFIKNDAVIKLYSDAAKTVSFGSGTDQSGNVFWFDGDSNSGYCSIVDNNRARYTTSTDFVAASGIFEQIFNFSGNLNTNLVERASSTDQEAVDWLRNGDGYYLASGPTQLLPRISERKSTWAIRDTGGDSTNKLGKFFSPATGLPLVCESTDRDTCGTNASDNRLITTSDLVNSSNTYATSNFPVGNSQISHNSIATRSEQTSSFAANNTVTGVAIIEEIKVQVDSSGNFIHGTAEEELTRTPAAIGSSVGSFTAGREDFDFVRGSTLFMQNGGDFQNTGTGRYGMEILSSQGREEYHLGVTNGVRCGVKINEY